eukprot:9291096-Pyramimonas_sp.AAC.1
MLSCFSIESVLDGHEKFSAVSTSTQCVHKGLTIPFDGLISEAVSQCGLHMSCQPKYRFQR